MKRKLLYGLLAFLLAGCTAAVKPEETAPTGSQGCDAFEECGDDTAAESHTEFKESYESLNGTVNASGKEHRTITIPDNNPFVCSDIDTAIAKMDAGESFYLYVGDPKCPWCRAIIETACAKAEEYGIKEILTINIWDEAGNEVLRDKYELKDGTPVCVNEGLAGYAELLKRADAFLDEYTVKDEAEQEVSVGEKRIFAPTYFRIENGAVVRMTTGIPEELSDPRSKLTQAQLQEMASDFDRFFG